MEFETGQLAFDSTVIYLMKYGDFVPEHYLAHLTAEETTRFHSFSHIKRQREFIATRILRHNIFGFKHIHYNPVGAPYIKDEGFISISHARNLVGIAFNKEFQTGLDLELIQDKAFRLKSKFLNESEYALLETESKLEMTKCWSAKETLYKLAGRKEIDFRKHLHLEKSGEFSWKGKIINPSETLCVDLHIFEYEDYIISFNSSAIVSTQN